MKKITLSVVTLLALGNIVYAGGDFSVVTPYEVEDVQMAEETYVEPAPVEEYVAPAPIVEPAPAPIVEPAPAPVVVEPAPVVIAPVPVKDINPSGFYAGLGISAARYKSNCSTPASGHGCGPGKVDNTVGGMARVGYDFNKHIGIEARGIRTSLNSNGGEVQHAGLFLKPMVPVGDKTNVYGLVGLAKTKTKGSMQKVNADGLALGLGVEVDLSKDTPKEGRYGRTFDGKGNQEKGLGVFADYERMLVKKGAPDLDAVSAGVTYDF